ncbi:MAG: acyl-CoA dehydrogenase [Actinomycetota bacterium]
MSDHPGILLNPHRYDAAGLDEADRALMEGAIAFFEGLGKDKITQDDLAGTWYRELIDYFAESGVLATLMTPEGHRPGASWNTWRNNHFSEITAFYSLGFWYAWQVSMLGLGPIWMGGNEAVKERAAALLEEGAIFAFGLSEQSHGADIYSSEMRLTPTADGTYVANGSKYYIGNGNEAALVSVFGKVHNDETGEDDYVFFVVESSHDAYVLEKNTVHSPMYVSAFRLEDYPITEADILVRGPEAWNVALNTINVCKYNLGWASIGIGTHALYEAINHAGHRELYGGLVTDFAHVRQLFVDAYTRLTAMKLFAGRANDYLRSASDDDRRYLLYNPMVKMKVTTEGERVIDALWDVIAAKGFEKDTYFNMATHHIRALPKLEGTVHVNIALIVKFMPNYFFAPAEYEPVPARRDGAHDEYLFHQAPTRGLGKITFHDWSATFDRFDHANVAVFREQVETFRTMLAAAPPTDEQTGDIDFLLALGELFSQVVYGQLILEASELHGVADATVEQIFDVLIRDFSAGATRLHGKSTTSQKQAEFALQMVQRPTVDDARFETLWSEVLALLDTYELPR